jgi:Pvc16 N-terminal domain
LATYHAIAATGQAILGLLERACPKPEFEGAIFELYQAKDFQNPMEEGVSLYLYRVATSSRRNLPPRIGPNGQHYRPPLPLDLYFLLTAWAKSAAKQQRLLGFCIREIGDTPILPASLLNHFGPEPDTFRPDEAVELIFESLTLQDTSNLWEPLKPNVQPSATYVARMISIESFVELPDSRPVQTREFDFAKMSKR